VSPHARVASAALDVFRSPAFGSVAVDVGLALGIERPEAVYPQIDRA
jgi:hypothetical protein